MVKNKNKPKSFNTKIQGRKFQNKDRGLFLRRSRSLYCLAKYADKYLEVSKLDPNLIRETLARCQTIEHQFIALRHCTQLTKEDYQRRCKFTSEFLHCLSEHHGAVYEGILFGSTVNGLGFKDSDVDLRLRRLVRIAEGVYEPIALSDDMIDKILRDIAFQTTRCCTSIGDFVPSMRCPVAKLTFFQHRPSNGKHFERNNEKGAFREGLKYDVSLSTSNPLASFNSKFLRFLCHLEPKFHLLATVIRYWSSAHELIVPGYLSSYALVNMLIFFCQTTEPPLLPTVDEMRDIYFKTNPDDPMDGESNLRAITQLEWHCIVCLEKNCYTPSKNKEPLSVLLLKFFEFCLKFPYSTHIMTIRPGRALSHKEFETTTQFHPRFPISSHLCIQDPFDLKHNLTSGMQGGHFRLFMVTIRYSYERLFNELMHRFFSTRDEDFKRIDVLCQTYSSVVNEKKIRKENWGLNTLFNKITEQELKDA